MKNINKECNGGTFKKVLDMKEGQKIKIKYKYRGSDCYIIIKCLENKIILK